MITVKLHPALQKKEFKVDGNGIMKIPCEDRMTVAELLALLKIQTAATGIILVNGKYAKTHDVLNRDDKLEIYPIFGGG